MELAVEMGILSERIEFEEYSDDSFVKPLDAIDWGMDALPKAAAGVNGDGE